MIACHTWHIEREGKESRGSREGGMIWKEYYIYREEGKSMGRSEMIGGGREGYICMRKRGSVCRHTISP